MGANTFGEIFKITTFGESHGVALGVIIDGCPAGLQVDTDFINSELARRRPGQSKIVTQRKEADQIEVLSGIFEGKTQGTPIALLIKNTNAKSKDYSHIKEAFRPSHADMTYHHKYGHRDYRGGGRSSARETAARVAAGAIAKLILKQFDIDIKAWVHSVGDISIKEDQNLDLSSIESNPVRCPDPKIAEAMEERILQVRKQGDTIGGTIKCLITNCPAGLGAPVFDKLHADLAKGVMSINACKGFEYGSGFEGTNALGSTQNDLFEKIEGKIQTKTNHSGGIQGGISNGMPIYFKAAFKAVATIMQDQKSVDVNGNPIEVSGKGRHDPCVLPRAVPIVEAMAALTLCDHLLRTQTDKINNLTV